MSNSGLLPGGVLWSGRLLWARPHAYIVASVWLRIPQHTQRRARSGSDADASGCISGT